MARRPHRVVVLSNRLRHLETLTAALGETERVWRPDNTLEAGICAASASVVIIDLQQHPFGDVIDWLSALKHFNPRAIRVGLLEEGETVDSLPECGFHLLVETPLNESAVGEKIKHYLGLP